MTTAMAEPLDRAALVCRFIDRGLRVIEVYGVNDAGTCLCPKSTECRTAGKHPRGKAWQQQTGLSQADVYAVLEERPHANFGAATGNGIFVVDIEADGRDSAANLAQRGLLSPTLTISTGGGGRHLIYRVADGVKIGNSVQRLARSVDIRGDGGMVVLPPSRSGKGHYAIASDTEISAAPPALLEAVMTPRRPALALVHDDSTLKADPTVQSGQHAAYETKVINAELARVQGLAMTGWDGAPWDITTFETACTLIEMANAPWTSITLEQMHTAFVQACPPAEPGYDPAAKWQSALARVGSKARDAPAPRVSDLEAMFGPAVALGPSALQSAGQVEAVVQGTMTDANVADAFVRWITGRVIYCPGLGWLRWDGRKWAQTDEAVILHESKVFAQALTVAAARSGDSEQLKAAVPRMNASTISAVVRLAKGNPGLRAEVSEFDADPYLLNCANGTLDLRTRSLRPHDPRDMLTKVTAGAYDPSANSGTWEAFLTSILPDGALRDYLRRIVGQAIYGRVREHLFPVLTGVGANGKGSTYGAITHTLGEYATVINPEILMARERGGIGGPEMMTLRGARLVVGSETEEGRRLDEATMKRLTGGDELTARNLYCPPVTWQPSHQLIYVTNALPKVKGNDPAVWRRIRVIPFNVVVPTERRDPELGERLAREADAILTWAIAGWFDYLDNGGMREPAAVLLATGQYQVQSDSVARFIDEACEAGPHFHTPGRELYAAWQRWALIDGADPMTEKAFAGELDRLGHESRKTSRANVRLGLRLLDEDSPR